MGNNNLIYDHTNYDVRCVMARVDELERLLTSDAQAYALKALRLALIEAIYARDFPK